MFCARCETELLEQPERCSHCQESPLLDGRYRLELVLGQGSSGTTYKATRIEDGRIVAIKELPFRALSSVKEQELFEREARVLGQLSHPQIPNFEDTFVFGEGKSRAMYIAQEFVDGQTIEQEMATKRYTELEVLKLIRTLAEPLSYLQSLSPPVVHRDLKPSNLVRRSDGQLMMIDFGAVTDGVKSDEVGGSTVAGTFGYMAPEQFKGQSSTATDIYALGVIAVVLLARKQPEAMIDDHHRLIWAPHVSAHPAVRKLLAQMLETNPATRLNNAQELCARVDRIQALVIQSAGRPQLPAVVSAPAPPANPGWSRAIVPLALLAGVGAAFMLMKGGSDELETRRIILKDAAYEVSMKLELGELDYDQSTIERLIEPRIPQALRCLERGKAFMPLGANTKKEQLVPVRFFIGSGGTLKNASLPPPPRRHLYPAQLLWHNNALHHCFPKVFAGLDFPTHRLPEPGVLRLLIRLRLDD